MTPMDARDNTTTTAGQKSSCRRCSDGGRPNVRTVLRETPKSPPKLAKKRILKAQNGSRSQTKNPQTNGLRAGITTGSHDGGKWKNLPRKKKSLTCNRSSDSRSRSPPRSGREHRYRNRMEHSSRSTYQAWRRQPHRSRGGGDPDPDRPPTQPTEGGADFLLYLPRPKTIQKSASQNRQVSHAEFAPPCGKRYPNKTTKRKG